VHAPDFALDVDIFVLNPELSPDENHDGGGEGGSACRCPGAELAAGCRAVRLVLSQLSSALC